MHAEEMDQKLQEAKLALDKRQNVLLGFLTKNAKKKEKPAAEKESVEGKNVGCAKKRKTEEKKNEKKAEAEANKRTKGSSSGLDTGSRSTKQEAKRKRQDMPRRRSSRNSTTKTGGVLVNTNVKLGPGLGEEEGLGLGVRV